MNKAKFAGTCAAVGLFLMAAVPAFAVDPTPTITVLDATASQLLVNSAGSVQATIISVLELIWPYALKLMLIFLGIGIGLRIFNHRR
jgi:hypothetical protein